MSGNVVMLREVNGPLSASSAMIGSLSIGLQIMMRMLEGRRDLDRLNEVGG